MSNNQNKTILVTGASTGIGFAIAVFLAKKNFQVLAGVRKNSDGEHLKEASDGKVIPVQLDLLKDEDITNVKALVDREYGGELYSLVNNAGVLSAAPIEMSSMDNFRQEIEVNYLGTVALTKAFLPAIKKVKGRIVNMSSMNGQIPMPIVAGYSASKFAIEAFSDALRMEIKAFGVKVIIVEPGQIKTEIFGKALESYAKLINNMSPKEEEEYGALIKGGDGALQAGNNSPRSPDVVAEVVYEALVNQNPETRYIVGDDAKGLIDGKSTMSDEEMDTQILQFFGL